MKRTALLAPSLGLCLLAAALTGCAKSSDTTVTPQMQAQFKGGPMPESARKMMAQKMQEAAQKAHNGH